jgi:DNA (cytosine-5)-methyltransferase 3A
LNGLKVLSICGGIETGLLALLELGIPISEYHTYEILPEAIAVSSYHFPWIIHHGDVIGADFSQFKGFDLVIAGTCCQSLTRIRIEDKTVNNGLKGKSGIFFEFVRALDEINPKWFMLENVVPSDENDLFIMNSMVSVSPKLINSNLFSAQDRERYYWTNFEIPELPIKSSIVLKDIMEADVEEKYYYKDKNFEIVNMNKKVCAKLKVNTTEMCKRIYNPEFKMATLTCINGGYQEKKVLHNGRPRKLTEIEYERAQTLPDNYTNVELNGRKLSYSKRCSLCGNGWNKETVKHIFIGLMKYI